MNTREIQLLKLGFHLNENQDCYILYKYDSPWYVELWKLTDYKENRWNVLIDDLIYDIEQTRIHFIEDLKESEGYNFAKKEIKQKLLDELNKYRSWLQQETQSKMGRGNPNFKIETELKAKIELIKELMNEK